MRFWKWKPNVSKLNWLTSKNQRVVCSSLDWAQSQPNSILLFPLQKPSSFIATPCLLKDWSSWPQRTIMQPNEMEFGIFHFFSLHFSVQKQLYQLCPQMQLLCRCSFPITPTRQLLIRSNQTSHSIFGTEYGIPFFLGCPFFNQAIIWCRDHKLNQLFWIK